jgi:hypothetical protein
MLASLEENLNEFLDQGLPTEEQQGFVIDNDEKADWAIRKILRLQQKNNDIKQLAELQINKIKQWQERESEGNDSSINYLTALLAPYAKSQLDGKKKTVKMPSGNISFRAKSPEYFIAGNKVDGKSQPLIDHVKKTDTEYLKIEESVNWSEFKDTLTPLSTGKVLTNDGEILEFISAVEYPDTVSVKERK